LFSAYLQQLLHYSKQIKTIGNNIIVSINSIFGKNICPLCGNRVRSFLPLSNYYFDNLKKHGWKYSFEEIETLNVKNYSCPFCGASDRDRPYALYIQEYFGKAKLHRDFRIIHFAPSEALSFFIKKRIIGKDNNIKYRTADLFTEGAEDKVDIMNKDIYRDNYFDFFICSHILEHVRDDRKALRELYRILKLERQGILMVPIGLSIDEIDEDPSITEEAERWRRFGQYDHIRLYSKNGFLERAKEAGFVVDQLGQEYFCKDIFANHGITCQSVLYIVKK